MVHLGRSFTCRWILDAVGTEGRRLDAAGIGPGAVVALESGASPVGVALLLALVERGAITVPLAPDHASPEDGLYALAECEWRIVVPADGPPRIESSGRKASHSLFRELRREGHPGLVLFTSGSSGEPKASLHDWTRLLRKYKQTKPGRRTLLFLLFDHIGGLDTLLQTLANGGVLVVPSGRGPAEVCATIERHRVEVLPASPSFLTLLLLSEAWKGHDVSSLRYITYGAEVMPQATLDRLVEVFPRVTMLQKYGITEIGTMRSRSRANDSLWVRIGGEGYATRVVDGLLEVKAESSIVGYLNAPSPFTADGWFMTGDAVEVDGDFVRILGRASDLINVGGRKVYPAEVEGVILELPEVAEAAVLGERHPFTGQIVVARVLPRQPIEARALEIRIRAHCRARLEPYKVPVRVDLADGPLHSERQKIRRR